MVIFLAYLPIKKHKKKLLETKVNNNARLIPFRHLFDLKNPLQLGVFTAALIITLIRILMWLINDINAVEVSFDLIFFLPYVLELVGGIIGYLFMQYLLLSLASKDRGI